MRKHFLLILALCATMMAWGAEVTVTKTAKEIAEYNGGWTKSTAYATAKLDDVITITVTPGDGTNKNGMYYTGDYTDTHDWRMYQARANGQFAISAAQGYVITSVTLTYKVTNTGVVSTSMKESGVATPDANQILSGTPYPFAARELTFYVGNITAATTNGQARICSFSVTYEKGIVEEFRDPVGDTLWNHGTAATTKLGTYGEWEMEGIRHTNPSNAMDKLQTNSTPGVGIGWVNKPHMQTTAEGGVKVISFLWNQGATANEKDKTEKITVTVGDKTKNDSFTGKANTSVPADRTFAFSPEVKSNATLRLEGVNGNRIVVGPITIVPYLRYTYTETQEVKIGVGTFDCSLQRNNTDDEGTITYSSDNTDIVSFANSANPEATLVGGGEATITATWSEGASTSFKLKVIAKSTPEISFENDAVTITDLYTTEPVENKLTVTEGAGEVTYKSSNPLVAKIVENQVVVVGVGTATITATADENEDYLSASASYALTVNEPEGETAVKENFKGKLNQKTSYTDTDTSFTDQLGLYRWKVNGYRYNNVYVRLKNTQTPYLKFDGNQEGGIKRLIFTWFRAGKDTDLLPIRTSIKVMDGDNELKDASINLEASADHTNQLPYNCRIEVKQSAQLVIDNASANGAVMHFQDIKIVPYLLFTTKSDEAFLSLVEEYDVKDVLINNTDDGTVVYSILTDGVQSQISDEGVVDFTNVTKSETITIQAAWTPAGESSATVTTTMTLYVDVESKTDKTVDEKFTKYSSEGWTNSEGSEVIKYGDVYDWRVQLTRHKTTDKLVDDQQAIWFAQDGYVATADAEDNTKIGPAEGGIKRIAFKWNQNAGAQTGDKLYISVSVDGTEMSAIKRDGGAQPEQPWQYIHNLNVKKNATLKIENKSTTSETEGGRVKIGTIVITPYLLYTTKEVSKMISDESYINPGLINNINKDLDGGTLTFTSSDEAVATIATGDETHKDKVVFHKAGDVTISANWTPDGVEEPAITTSYLLHITEKADRGLSFQYAVKETTVGGSAVTNTLNGTLDATEQTWSTASDGAITSVDNVGLVSPFAIGTDTVTVVVKESEAYQEGTASYKVIVRTGVADNKKLVESFSGLTKGTSDTKWEGDLKDYFSWKTTSARHNGTAGDTIGGNGVAGTVLFAQGQIATDGVIEGGVKYFTFNWKQPYMEQGATLRLTLNAGDKSYQQDYVVATDNGGTTHEHLYFAGNMQVKKNVQLILKNESFKTDGGAALTENGRIAIDKFEIVPYLFYKTKSHKIDVVKGDAPTWTNTDLINNTEGGTVEYSIEDVEGEGVAEINATNGQVTTKSNGKAKVTATWTPTDALEGEVVTTTYTLEVFAERLDAELAFDSEEITVGVNETTITTPTLINPHELTVKYSSSDEDIATVDENSGTVTLKGVAGDVTISATSEETDTYKEGNASYTIHVQLLTPVVTFPNLTENKKTVDIDQTPFTETILIKVNDEDVTSSATITYESSNENVAIIKENQVNVIGVGTTIITAKIVKTEIYAATEVSYTLTVAAPSITEDNSWTETFSQIEEKTSWQKSSSVTNQKGDSSVFTWQFLCYRTYTSGDWKIGLRSGWAKPSKKNDYVAQQTVSEGGIKYISMIWVPNSNEATNPNPIYFTMGDMTSGSILRTYQAEANTLSTSEPITTTMRYDVKKNAQLRVQIKNSETESPEQYNSIKIKSITVVPYLLYTKKEVPVTYNLEGTNTVDASANLINNLEVGETVTYSLSAGAQATIDGSTITLANATEDVTVTATWGEVSTTFTLKVTKAEEPIDELVLQDTEDNSEVIEENDGKTLNVTIKRGFTAGTYNTLSLPFAVNKDDLATALGRTITSLAQYSSEATLDATNANLNITIEEATSIVAGNPYLLQFEGYDISTDDDIAFEKVTIVKTKGDTVGEGTQFIGGINPTKISAENTSILFVVAGNKLAWNATGVESKLKGFRAYFNVPGMTEASGVAPRLVMRAPHTPTGCEALKQDAVQAQKFIFNNQLYIRREGKMFNAQGQIVK